MTTITREQQKQILIDTANHVISRDNTSPYSENLRELARIALAALTAEPVAWTDEQELKDVEKDGSGYLFTVNPITPNADPRRVIKLYTVPPVQETGVYKDMLNIIGLLENNEWAEHCTSTVLGSLLESEITRLVGKEQPALVVPEDLRRSFEAVARLNNEMYRWTSCMSYNGSYVGEPEGLLKRNIREIERILDRCKSDKGE
ncbi:hypothetical protein DV583_09395 [Salmonella enterica]|nr:hypothetical protein [Salmonella enterica]ECJ2214032.1 hypothetical protein [Salmonella enterica]ECQ9653014.1 hypothetical protein [Salmonella enterica]EEL2021934.1 hypothetical protein [Salmonella enterica]EGX9711770.1 hypothetical protein [Salmonella enterica]